MRIVIPNGCEEFFPEKFFITCGERKSINQFVLNCFLLLPLKFVGCACAA